MNSGQHHQHLRKRLYKNLEEYPHKNPLKRFLDTLIFVIGAIGPLATLPQLYTIYIHHSATNISTLSWSLYWFFSFIWLLYGIVHKEKAIILTNFLWIIMNGLVVLGSVLY